MLAAYFWSLHVGVYEYFELKLILCHLWSSEIWILVFELLQTPLANNQMSKTMLSFSQVQHQEHCHCWSDALVTTTLVFRLPWLTQQLVVHEKEYGWVVLRDYKLKKNTQHPWNDIVLHCENQSETGITGLCQNWYCSRSFMKVFLSISKVLCKVAGLFSWQYKLPREKAAHVVGSRQQCSQCLWYWTQIWPMFRSLENTATAYTSVGHQLRNSKTQSNSKKTRACWKRIWWGRLTNC